MNMKNFLIGIFSSVLMMSQSYAYDIGGAFATLESCKWGQYGYEYGYIGTYKIAGQSQRYQVFFGDSYCEY